MAIGTRAEADRRQEESRHEYLVAVAALLLLLRQRANRELPSQPQTAAEVLRLWFANAFLYGRTAAANAGFRSLQAEFALFEPGLRLTRPQWDGSLEVFRAQRAARGYSRHWLDDVAKGSQAGAKDPRAFATQQQAWRLELGAQTEVAAAFNVERERTLNLLAAERPEIAALYVRVWDSALGKNTCEVCSSAHGSWVPVGESFPEGTPGQVHNRCNCEDHVEPRDWADALMRAA